MTNDDIIFAGDEQRILELYGFDRTAFQRNAADLAAGKFRTDRNRIRGKVEKPGPKDVLAWPDGTAGRDAERLGHDAIAKGEVAVAILNGGMATRFGGMVKCLVKVVGEHTFLDLKLRDVISLHGPVTVFLMNSFATDVDTRAHLTARDYCGVPASH